MRSDPPGGGDNSIVLNIGLTHLTREEKAILIPVVRDRIQDLSLLLEKLEREPQPPPAYQQARVDRM
jgi:hypothetical protein